MKKNPKGEQIDFIGIEKEKKKSKKKSKANKNSNRINLDNEIIIGLTPKKEKQKNIGAGHRARPKKEKVKKKKEKNIQNKKTKVKSKKVKTDTKESKTKKRIIKWTSITVLIIICIILFILSPVFNIRTINVVGANKVAAAEIIAASGIKKNENMFKMNVWKVEQNIEKDPYISKATINRKLDGTVNINIEERVPSYMIVLDDKYMYIDNQGYMLEISEQPLAVPTLIGYKTETKDIAPGNRLYEEDLIKLNTCIKIMEAAEGNNIEDLITSIDISNINEYILNLETKGIVVHFGDSSKINQKILWILYTVNDVDIKPGDLFLDSKRVYFRENI